MADENLDAEFKRAFTALGVFGYLARMVIFCLIDFAVEAQVRASVARRSRDRGGRGSWPDMNSLPATGAWKPARMAPSPRMAWRRPSGRCLGDLQVQLCPHHRASRQH